MKALLRIASMSGFIAVVANVLAIVALQDIPSAYRLGEMDIWIEQVRLHGDGAARSAALFTIGVVALVPFAYGVARAFEQRLAGLAAVLIAAGGLMNGAGTLTPLVVGVHLFPECADVAICVPAARALLGYSLAMDALFNLLFGLGLVVLSFALPTRARQGLAFVAGLLTMVVSLQVVSDTGAKMLAVAGPLWLITVVVESVALWRRSAAAGV